MVASIFFIKVQTYPKQKYWIHQFNILLGSLCFVSLLPVAFYSWSRDFHTVPALLYHILPCIILLFASYFWIPLMNFNLQSIQQIFNWIQVRRLTWSVVSTNTIIFKPFLCKFCVTFGIIVVLNHEIPTMS